MLKLILILICFITLYNIQVDAVINPKVVCYYEYWAHYREGRGKMEVESIDSSLCTHLVYAYLGISNDFTVSILDPWLMQDLNDLNKFSRIKGKAKAMIAIGGSAQSSKFSAMAQTDADRTAFVNSVISLMKKHNFDGVMIDWQYPNSKDIHNYVKLLDKFDEKFTDTAFVLGITGAPLKTVIEEGFDVKNLIEFVDFVHVLTFDFHGLWDSKVDYAAPLDWQIESLKHWWSKGAPRDKLLMSIPLFARTWTLTKEINNERTASADGPGKAGPYTQVPGLLSYNELCNDIKSNPTEWTIRRETDGTAVYALHGREWISFEDSKTCALKAKNATTEGFGGIVAYALSNEDFRGDCGNTKFPLLHGINSGLNRDPIKVVNPQTENPSVVHSTKQTITQSSIFVCHKNGKFRDPFNCQKYHVCSPSDITGLWEDTIVLCTKPLVYDESSDKCVDREKVSLCATIKSSTTS